MPPSQSFVVLSCVSVTPAVTNGLTLRLRPCRMFSRPVSVPALEMRWSEPDGERRPCAFFVTAVDDAAIEVDARFLRGRAGKADRFERNDVLAKPSFLAGRYLDVPHA